MFLPSSLGLFFIPNSIFVLNFLLLSQEQIDRRYSSWRQCLSSYSSAAVMAVHQTRHVVLPLINLLRLKGVSILEQLHLEERLLRTSSDNWCIINDGTIDPTVVMGISGLVIFSFYSSLLYVKYDLAMRWMMKFFIVDWNPRNLFGVKFVGG